MILIRTKIFSLDNILPIQKVFPKISLEIGLDYSEKDVLNLKFTRSKDQLTQDICNIIWEYEISNGNFLKKSDITPKDIVVYELSSINNPSQINISVEAEKGGNLERKVGRDYFWEVNIDLTTGKGDVVMAGD